MINVPARKSQLDTTTQQNLTGPVISGTENIIGHATQNKRPPETSSTTYSAADEALKRKNRTEGTQRKMGIADRIRAVMADRNISAAELGRRLGYPPRAMARQLREGVFLKSEVESIANALGCPPERLLPQWDWALDVPDAEAIAVQLIKIYYETPEEDLDRAFAATDVEAIDAINSWQDAARAHGGEIDEDDWKNLVVALARRFAGL